MMRAWVTSGLRGKQPMAWSQEVSGSLGDLGTFLPLLVGMVQAVQLDLGTTLIFTGVYNIASGLVFGVPMAVQPMKTIAALAIAGSIDLDQALCGGLFVSATVMLMGVTRIMGVFNVLVPVSVVRGIQLHVGLKLAMKGADMAFRHHMGASHAAQFRTWLGVEGLLVSLLVLAYLFLSTLPPKQQSHKPTASAAADADQPATLGAALQPARQQLNKLWGILKEAWRGQPTAPVQARLQCASRQADEESAGQKSDCQLYLTSQHTASSLASPSASDHPAEQSPLLKSQGSQDDAATPTVIEKGEASTEAVSTSVAVTGCSTQQARTGTPAALLVVLLGLIAAAWTNPDALSSLQFGPSKPHLLKLDWRTLRDGILKAGLPQLPLTTLNSVIATCQLATASFPHMDANRWRPNRVAASVGLMNLCGCWFGALPCCHGSGGLAAQMKFGARTGAAPMMLGGIKLFLGLLLGSSLFTLLSLMPSNLLGGMLLLSGLELAGSCKQEDSLRGWSLMLLTAAVGLGIDTLTGFLAGMGAAVLVVIWELLLSPVLTCLHAKCLGRLPR